MRTTEHDWVEGLERAAADRSPVAALPSRVHADDMTEHLMGAIIAATKIIGTADPGPALIERAQLVGLAVIEGRLHGHPVDQVMPQCRTEAWIALTAVADFAAQLLAEARPGQEQATVTSARGQVLAAARAATNQDNNEEDQ